MADEDVKEPSELISVRMPPALAEALRREAAQNTRSVSGEIVHRIKQSFGLVPAQERA